jgi:NADH-quinone oxidoreductase subunit E
MLNDLGIFHYDQIARWTDAEVDWINAYLKFPGRMMRDGWVEQARSLAARHSDPSRLN